MCVCDILSNMIAGKGHFSAIKSDCRWRSGRMGEVGGGQGEMDPQISQITFPCIQKVRLHTDNSCQRGTHPKCKHRWSGIITRTAGWGAGGNEMVYDGSAHPLMPAPNVPSSPRDVLCEKQEKIIWFAQAVRHPGRSRNVRGTSLMVGGFGPLGFGFGCVCTE